MNEKDFEKQLAEFSKLRTSSNKDIKRIEHEFTKSLCPKGKMVCEPSYCIFQITNTCPFLKKWRYLVEKYNIPCC